MAKFDELKHCVELDRDDLLEASNYIEELILAAHKAYDDLLYECFAIYGFTKEWLLDPNNFRHINIDRYALTGCVDSVDSVYVYGQRLFDISMVRDHSYVGYKMKPIADPDEIKKRFGIIDNAVRTRKKIVTKLE